MANKTTKYTLSIAAAAMAISVATTNDAEAFTKKAKMEKCYGVAKAGKNDCGSKNGSHSCAGQAKIDGDKNEWLLLPKGLCDRIVGGSTK